MLVIFELFQNYVHLLQCISFHHPYVMHETKLSLDDTHLVYNIDFFAERYIHGRDFTISMVARQQAPICEVIFFGYYDDDKARVFDYNAKWVKDTPEYDNTDIEFDFKGISQETKDEMTKIATECWDIFNLKGYARVDFRVDEQGNPFVLEINPNPCITRKIMFDNNLKQGGVDYVDAIQEIVNDIKNIY